MLSLYVYLALFTSLATCSPAPSRITPPPIPHLLQRSGAPIPHLLARAVETCQTNYTQCPSTNVCCPSDTTCIPLSNNTQVACCNIGEDCRIVQPLTCGTDAAQGGETCSSGASAGKCCPGGYVCAGDFCQMPFEDWPVEFGGTVTLAPTAASTATALAAGGAGGTCQTFPPAALASGFFPGLVVGALLIAAISFCIDRRRLKSTQTFKRMPDNSPLPTQNIPTASRFQSQHSATKSMQEMVICFAPDNSMTPNAALAAEAERRGRPRVHGETPQLPSVHGFPDDVKRHQRSQSSNPNYMTSNQRNITQYPSTEKLRTASMSSDTTVSSSVHTVPRTIGQRYPIAVPASTALHVRTSIPYSYDDNNNSTPTTIDDSTPSPTNTVPPHAPDAPRPRDGAGGRSSDYPDLRDNDYTAGSAYPNSVYDPYYIPTPSTPVPVIPPLFSEHHVTSPIDGPSHSWNQSDMISPLESDISPIGASIARIGSGTTTHTASQGSFEMVVGMASSGTPRQGGATRVGAPLGQKTMNGGRYTLQTQKLETLKNRI